jgi:hypothetical protein
VSISFHCMNQAPFILTLTMQTTLLFQAAYKRHNSNLDIYRNITKHPHICYSGVESAAHPLHAVEAATPYSASVRCVEVAAPTPYHSVKVATLSLNSVRYVKVVTPQNQHRIFYYLGWKKLFLSHNVSTT